MQVEVISEEVLAETESPGVSGKERERERERERESSYA